MPKKIMRLAAALLGTTLAIPANAGIHEIVVGSCPTPVSLALGGIWEGAEADPETARTMEANPGRTAKVAAVFHSLEVEGANLSVMSLGGLEPFQGSVSGTDFSDIAVTLTGQAASPDADFLRRLETEIEKRHSPAPDFQLREGVEIGEDRLVAYGRTQQGAESWLTAMVMEHVSGCVVNITIAVPEVDGAAEIVAAAADVQVEQ
jgi:hypothetical protein